jgi:NAD(P)H-hydrate repair Nnr-like enzyme with NAD(P)H-hydrate dehydratase domain
MELFKNSPKLWLPKFPWKTKSSNKYSRGRVLILGAQKNMIGATILAAESCLRVGVDLGGRRIIKKKIPILSRKFPSALKIEINNFSFLKSFLKK